MRKCVHHCPSHYEAHHHKQYYPFNKTGDCFHNCPVCCPSGEVGELCHKRTSADCRPGDVVVNFLDEANSTNGCPTHCEAPMCLNPNAERNRLAWPHECNLTLVCKYNANCVPYSTFIYDKNDCPTCLPECGTLPCLPRCFTPPNETVTGEQHARLPAAFTSCEVASFVGPIADYVLDTDLPIALHSPAAFISAEVQAPTAAFLLKTSCASTSATHKWLRTFPFKLPQTGSILTVVTGLRQKDDFFARPTTRGVFEIPLNGYVFGSVQSCLGAGSRAQIDYVVTFCAAHKLSALSALAVTTLLAFIAQRRSLMVFAMLVAVALSQTTLTGSELTATNTNAPSTTTLAGASPEALTLANSESCSSYIEVMAIVPETLNCPLMVENILSVRALLSLRPPAQVSLSQVCRAISKPGACGDPHIQGDFKLCLTVVHSPAFDRST
jgi:hypothetical protein